MMKLRAFFMCIFSSFLNDLLIKNSVKTGMDTAFNITNLSFRITGAVMKIKKILVQYFHIATKVLIELLSVRAGLYVKQN